MEKILFIECALDDSFTKADVQALLDNADKWHWLRLDPVVEEANNTRVFGFIPGELMNLVEFNEANFRRELRFYAANWNHKVQLDPFFGYEVVFQKSSAYAES